VIDKHSTAAGGERPLPVEEYGPIDIWLPRFAEAMAEVLHRAIEEGPTQTKGALDAFRMLNVKCYTVELNGCVVFRV